MWGSNTHPKKWQHTNRFREVATDFKIESIDFETPHEEDKYSRLGVYGSLKVSGLVIEVPYTATPSPENEESVVERYVQLFPDVAQQDWLEYVRTRPELQPGRTFNDEGESYIRLHFKYADEREECQEDEYFTDWTREDYDLLARGALKIHAILIGKEPGSSSGILEYESWLYQLLAQMGRSSGELGSSNIIRGCSRGTSIEVMMCIRGLRLLGRK